jgi:CheY-like chemotaxis protein
MFDESESTKNQRCDPHKRRLDVTPTPHDAASATRRVSANGRALRVLIVDGNAHTADALAQFVRQCGHNVRWTCDGATALKVAVAHESQVVLLAIGMKEMDGYELAQQLRLDARLKKCFLIAMRHKADAWGHEQCNKADIDLFLAKPIDHLVLETLLMWEGERLQESRTRRSSV